MSSNTMQNSVTWVTWHLEFVQSQSNKLQHHMDHNLCKMYIAHLHTDIISIHYSLIFINNYFLCQSLCFTVVQLQFLGYGTTSLGDRYLIFLRRFSGLI